MNALARLRRSMLRVEALEDRCVPTLLGQQIFPVDNPWNQQITNAPVAANSAAVMSNIVGNYGDGRFHPDFSQQFGSSAPLYGIPYNVVHGNSTARVTVHLDAYASEADPVPVPLPANPVIEGDFQNGPRAGLNNRGDSHLLVYDVDNNVAYEFYHASRPTENSDGQWHADHEAVWDMKTNAFRTLGWTSADAAGLSILAGLVRPDEALPVSQGGQGVIRHAIRFTLENSIVLDQFQYPASHVANPGNTNAAIQPPMGARFRLKASVDLSQLSPQSRIVAQAMKDYGLIVADNGSNFFLGGTGYSVDGSNHVTTTWDDNDVQDGVHGLKSLHYSDFEMVDLTPVVTGLSVHSGAAGTSVTVTGQNFSGAAGHLQVFFGTTPAASVTVVDDGHVTAVAPTGSGTVDVRVQSGVTTAADPQNIQRTVFGYGTSLVSVGDRFTFGTGGGGGGGGGGTQTATLGGVVFFDYNADGQQGTGEPGISGQTVFLDANGNGLLDTGEASVVTDAAGQYQFTGLAAGSYRVVEQVDTNRGVTQTTAGSFTVTVAAGANSGGWNFGNVLFSQVAPVIVVADRFAPHPNTNASTAFVRGLYHNVLARDAGASELSMWGNLLLNGTQSRSQVTVGIWNSAEHRTLQVNGYYRLYLGRTPGSGELGSWVRAMQNGLREEDAVSAFLGSAEFSASHASQTAFINDLYRDVLGRVVDAGGLALWQGLLNNGTSRAAVARAIVFSSESHQRAVNSYYAGYLHRGPGAGETSGWVRALDNGQLSFGSAALSFLAGGEYFAAAQADQR